MNSGIHRIDLRYCQSLWDWMHCNITACTVHRKARVHTCNIRPAMSSSIIKFKTSSGVLSGSYLSNNTKFQIPCCDGHCIRDSSQVLTTVFATKSATRHLGRFSSSSSQHTYNHYVIQMAFPRVLWKKWSGEQMQLIYLRRTNNRNRTQSLQCR